MNKRLLLLILLSLSVTTEAAGSKHDKRPAQSKNSSNAAKCLPPDIKMDDVVSIEGKTKITVGQELHELGAKCSTKGELVAANKRPIRFYHLVGCWGNPPQNYREIMANQARKIAELEKTSEVIRMTCNPSGAEIQ